MTRSQTILVTGATSGIGRHAALYLARKRHRVLASGRNQRALDELFAEANAQGLALDTLRLDVTSLDSIEAARRQVEELTDGGGIDVLVNNAGYGIAAPMSEISDHDLRRQFDTNVFGLMAVTRAFLPGMRQRGHGKIINVSSVGGRLTLPMYGAYNATKYAVESMSDALRIELAPFGIRVVLIEPGIIRTNFTPRSVEAVETYGGPEAPFAAAVRSFEALAQRSDAMAVGPECISRAIHRAVRRRSPAARYVAPLRARAALGLFGVLPTRVADALLRRVYGLSRKRMLVGSPPSDRLGGMPPADATPRPQLGVSQ